jgi:hypothetical protein
VTQGPQPASQPDARNAPQTPPPADAPVSDRFRSHEPSPPEEIRRKLFFGGALVLAMASVYAGLFGWKVVQYPLAGLAVLTVLIALITGAVAPRPPRPPGTGS